MKKLLAQVATSVSSTIAMAQASAGVALAQGKQTNLIGEPVQKPEGFAANIGVVINGVLSFVMVIAALLVLMYLIWGGIEWITSGGDKGKTESARNKITAAVIGLIVLAAAYAIFLLVIRFLGFESTDDLFNVRTLG